MPPVPEKEDPRAHNESLLKGSGERLIPMVARPGAQNNRREHQQYHCQLSEVKTHEENHKLQQSWGEAKSNIRVSQQCTGLAAVSGPGQHIVKTTLGPDIVLVSESTRNVVMMELTVPREDRMVVEL